uniref:CBS domain-containing protein n=1 Tax=Cucumis melo TaxID=3656 RepID=A0A9I9CZY9_CUCME
MQGIVRAIRSWQETLKKITVKQYSCRREMSKVENILEGSELGGGSPSSPKSLENITVREIVSKRGGGIGSSMISCRAEDTAIEAVQNMARHNIGSLVVMKSEGESIAGIVTERGQTSNHNVRHEHPQSNAAYDSQLLLQLHQRSSKKRIIQLKFLALAENRIRHVPVIDGKLVGMISIVDVVRAVVEQQNGELERLNDYIKGEYY